MYGFCNISLIPVRATASHRSELVTQLLFGEAYQIIDYQHCAGWTEIETQFDAYRGFIDINQVVLIHLSVYERYKEMTYYVPASQMLIFDKRRGFSFVIPAGSTVFTDEDNMMRIGAELFEIPEMIPNNDSFFKQLKTIALSFLNTPYLWGGRSIYGIDCSGFNQVVFKILGINLPRDASQQTIAGEEIKTVSQVQCGDLAFFQNSDGRITHTGLILDKNTIIHASGKVRVDRFDEQGIFSLERNEYTHQLHSIKRVCHF